MQLWKAILLTIGVYILAIGLITALGIFVFLLKTNPFATSAILFISIFICATIGFYKIPEEDE